MKTLRLLIMIDNFQSDKYPGRNNLARELKLNDADSTAHSPLLAEVVKRLKSPSTSGEVCNMETIITCSTGQQRL